MEQAKPSAPLVHPGEILLEEFMQPLGVSQNGLAIAIRVPLQRVHDIVHGRRAISVDTAVRLARFFGTSPDLWLNLQTHYELEKARDGGLFQKVEQDVRPVAGAI